MARKVEEGKKLKIFIACPIGSENSPERQRSDKLLKYVIYPVVKDLFKDDPEKIVIRADQMGEPGRITVQVLRELTTADVVIGDVTGTNANVMYEIGIRQALMRPFVLMAEKGQHLPFDLNDLRTVFYTLDLDNFELAQRELRLHLEKAMSGSTSTIDEALFNTVNNDKTMGSETVAQSSKSSQNLLAVLEVCETILHEAQSSKDLLYQIGNIVLEIKGSKEEKQKAQEQEMGMMIMSQLIQNPDSIEKIVPALQLFSSFAKQPSDELSTPDSLVEE